MCLVGASLFYGDSVVTPAISVISAVEGLEVISPAFHHYILPIALAILLGLFMAQKLGTGRVGKFFGPITVLWFVALAVVGRLVEEPSSGLQRQRLDGRPPHGEARVDPDVALL